MRRELLWSWPLIAGALAAAVWPSALREAAVGTGLGAAMMALASGLFRRTLRGSFEGFMMAFGAVFASQALLFLALALLAWQGGWAPAPLLLPYGLAAVGGTLGVALLLPLEKAKEPARAG